MDPAVILRIAAIIIGLAAILAAPHLPPPEGLSAPGLATLIVLGVMALWWVSEALPVTATALLPIAAFPLIGVAPIDAVAGSYMDKIIFLVLGAALLALSMEKWGLHRRLAIAAVRHGGTDGRSLVFAFMAATAFLSMWISNTATALIMTPIAVSVLVAILPQAEGRPRDMAAFAAALILGVSFAASIGGLGTLVGSPTNGIAVGILKTQLGLEITFLGWLAFGLPLVLATVPLVFLVLTRLACRFRLAPFDRAGVLTAIGTTGPMSLPEMRLLPILVLTVAAWLSMPFLKRLIPGLDDASVAILAAMVLFVIPSGRGGPLLDWRDTKAAPWDILLLYGGGLALAAAMKETGLAAWIGGRLSGLEALNILAFVLLLTMLVIAVTEFANNVATAAGFMPVLIGIAGATAFDPLILGMTAALAASWGFMMPGGNAPNAIAYATGHIRVQTMIRAGFLSDLIGLLAIPAAVFAGAAIIGR